jgi:hypothetical protein
VTFEQIDRVARIRPWKPSDPGSWLEPRSLRNRWPGRPMGIPAISLPLHARHARRRATSCPDRIPLAGVMEGVFDPAGMGGRCRRGVGRRESGGKPDPRTRPDWAAHDRIVAGQGGCGRDRIRTCVGNAGDFTDAPPAPHESRRIPTCPARPLVTCTNGLSTASAVTGRPRPFRPVSRSPMFGGGKSEGNPGRRLPRVPHLSPAAWPHSGR